MYNEDGHFIARLRHVEFTHDQADILLQVRLSADLVYYERWYDVEIVIESISINSVQKRFGK